MSILFYYLKKEFYLFTVCMWYKVFNSSEMTSGAPDIRSRPSIVFGKAITFLILFSLQSKQTRRSKKKKKKNKRHLILIRRHKSCENVIPIAIPPWGGAPYVNASSMCDNFVSSMFNILNICLCKFASWIRMEPPAISDPFITRS